MGLLLPLLLGNPRLVLQHGTQRLRLLRLLGGAHVRLHLAQRVKRLCVAQAAAEDRHLSLCPPAQRPLRIVHRLQPCQFAVGDLLQARDIVLRGVGARGGLANGVEERAVG